MVREQYSLLLPGAYRIHLVDGFVVLGLIGSREHPPEKWIITANQTGPVIPTLSWSMVKRVQLVEPANLEKKEAARDAVYKADAYGKTESCCECGEDYPQADLVDGEIYCLDCRIKEAERKLSREN